MGEMVQPELPTADAAIPVVESTQPIALPAPPTDTGIESTANIYNQPSSGLLARHLAQIEANPNTVATPADPPSTGLIARALPPPTDSPGSVTQPPASIPAPQLTPAPVNTPPVTDTPSSRGDQGIQLDHGDQQDRWDYVGRPAGWRNNLSYTQTLAYNLIHAGLIDPDHAGQVWNDHDKLIQLIDDIPAKQGNWDKVKRPGGWRNTLTKTRPLAINLISAGFIEPEQARQVWNDHDRLIQVIDDSRPDAGVTPGTVTAPKQPVARDKVPPKVPQDKTISLMDGRLQFVHVGDDQSNTAKQPTRQPKTTPLTTTDTSPKTDPQPKTGGADELPLQGDGAGTLARVAPENVSGDGGQRQAGTPSGGSRPTDPARNGVTDEQRLLRARSLGDGAGGVHSQETGTGSIRGSGGGRGRQGPEGVVRVADRSQGVEKRSSQTVNQPERADPALLEEAEQRIIAAGARGKFRLNINAIELLKENRPINADERIVLASYMGWGGLPQAFYKPDGNTTKGWEKEAAELKALLSEDEYQSARRSTQDAHYTSAEVITPMWQALERMGFKGGRVLEPSVGTGKFLGFMPTALHDQSTLSGIELDRITGSIANRLYPDAEIDFPVGFQAFNGADNSYDLAIGNPPFGSQKLYDPDRRAISQFSIHNYFFAKSVALLKPDGILAMVVSSFMMDANTAKAREYLAARTELLMAVRLPNNAFLKTAGTEVTTDILFLRKLRPDESPTGETWTQAASIYNADQDADVRTNEYFKRHPEHMLGQWGLYGSMYGPDKPALIARDGQDTAQLLEAALQKLPQNSIYQAATPQETTTRASETGENALTLPRNTPIKINAMFIHEDQVWMRADDEFTYNGDGSKSRTAVAYPVVIKNKKAPERIKGMIHIRDAFTRLSAHQLDEGATQAQIDHSRTELNRHYDRFVKRFSPINADVNKRLFREDVTWPQLSALEDHFDKGISAGVAKKTGEKARKPSATKAAIFSKRTQSPYKAPESAASARDALIYALSEKGRVDLDYMSRLYGKSHDAIVDELGDLIFDTGQGDYATREAYLSGNVKNKLKQARKLGLERNIEALEAVQPEDINPVDIDVKLGAHWIPDSDMTDFLKFLLDNTINGRVSATYNKTVAKWYIQGRASTSAATQWGTERVRADKLVESAANQKQVVVSDQDAKGNRISNEKETTLANQKMADIKEEFRRWIWSDDARRERLAQHYNDHFNTDVQRQYDGTHLTLPGKVSNDIIELRPHQANAVWRVIQSGATLLDHVVGAGKTFTMVAAAMELRRLKLAKKPLLVVPNHLVGQWAKEFIQLYPSANILATTKRDFEKRNRKRLFARMATGDWDVVIVAHSSFVKLDVDPGKRQAFVESEIAQIERAILQATHEEGKRSPSVKDMARRRDRLKSQRDRQMNAESKDRDSLTFDQIGIDALFLDEAHEFKNLSFQTQMSRVAGLGNPQGSQKAEDLYLKVQLLLEQTSGRNVVFATGTPISNTMAEMFTVQRYLQPEVLEEQGINHFDAWAKMYGEVVTDWELAPSGKYRLGTKFSKFVNIPELMQQYTSFADVINRDDINAQLKAQGKRLPVPGIKGGKPQNLVVERSQDQARYIGEPTTNEQGYESYPEGTLVYRSENIPRDKSIDNMLKVMSDARKAALDMRLVDPGYGDNPQSKVNVAADHIFRLYQKWNRDKGTQLVFCDLSTPKSARSRDATRIRELISKADAGDETAQEKLDKLSADELSALDSPFSVYDDLREKLVQRGIADQELAFIHEANTDQQKDELFGKVRSGRIRVLMGSTSKMGAGMNVQNRLVGLHHLDAPWRPSDLEQREGRIIRQGNELYERDPDGFEVEIFRYATRQTLDSRMWQTLEYKARFIEQIRKGDSKTRVIDDVGGEAANAAEMKAASSGNPLILEEMDVRTQLRKLEQLRSGHDRGQFGIRSDIRQLQRLIRDTQAKFNGLQKDLALALKAPEKFTITINDQVYTDRKESGIAILQHLARFEQGKQVSDQLGEYAGFPLFFSEGFAGSYVLLIEGASEYQTQPFTRDADPGGLSVRIANLVKMQIPAEEKYHKARVVEAKRNLPGLEAQLGPWEKEAEYKALKQRHAEIIAALRPGKNTQADTKDDAEDGVKHSKSAVIDKKARGVSTRLVQFYADNFLRKYKGADDVKVSVYATQEAALGADSRARYGLVKAAFNTKENRVLLIAANMNDGRDVQSALQHEVLVHKGLGLLPQAEVSRLLDTIRKNAPRSDSLKSLWQHVQRDYARESSATQAEELLARVAEKPLSRPDRFWNRIVSAIRDALVKIGFKLDLAAADLRQFIYRIGDEYRLGKRARTRFNDNQSPSPEGFFSSSVDDPDPLPEASWWDWVRFKAQDRFISLLKVQDTQPNLTEAQDAYVHETLYHGRTEYELEEVFKKQTLEPLVRHMKINGLSIEDMDNYLYARHAPEANARMEEINPDLDDNQALSGMSSEEAARIMDEFAGSGKLDKLKRVINKVDAIVEATRTLIVESGLETQATVDGWRNTYQFYAPLKGAPLGPGLLPTRGRGFAVRGRESRHRMGRKSAATDLLTNIVAQYETTVIRAQKESCRPFHAGLCSVNAGSVAGEQAPAQESH